MNFIEKIKNFAHNIDNLSVNSIVSGMIIYCVDNQMAICGAISLFVGTIISAMTKYNTMKQSKLSAIQEREIQMMQAKMDIRERESLLTNKINN